MPEETQELSRDEIKRVVEATPGWEWREQGSCGWAIKEGGDEKADYLYFAVTGEFESCYTCDAIAMVERLGLTFRLHYDPEFSDRRPWNAVIRVGENQVEARGDTLEKAIVWVVIGYLDLGFSRA